MFRGKFLEVNMQRNLFKFATLNSFKMVWMVSVVLFTCAIANAQVTLEQKRQVEGSVIASCIENFKIVDYKPDSITVSFTTREPMSLKVHSLSRRVSRNPFTGGPAIMRADNIGNYVLSDSDKKDHLFTIPVINGVLRIGRMFQLGLDAYNRTPSCDLRYSFTMYDPATRTFKSLNKLRLKGPKPKQ